MSSLSQCKGCGEKCCRYLATEIDTPRTDKDFDDIRWYVAHHNVSVFKHDGAWHLNFDTKCDYLGKDGRCTMYDIRPEICRGYEIDACEEDGLDYDVNLQTVEDVDEYTRQRRKRLAKRRRREKAVKQAK